MNFDNFTIKSQEAIQMAVDTVRRNGGQVVEPEHLLKAVIVKGESVVKFIFQKLGVNSQMVDAQLEKVISTQPKVSGGEQYLSRQARTTLEMSM